MIEKYRIDVLHFTTFLLISILLTILQGSFWFDTRFISSTPQLWIILIGYFSIFKTSNLSLLMIYFSSFFYASLTSMHFGKILCFKILIFLISWMGQEILNLKNKRIFISVCFAYSLFIPLYDWLLSTVIPVQQMSSYTLLSWTLSSILIIPLASGLHWCFKKIDLFFFELKNPLIRTTK